MKVELRVPRMDVGRQKHFSKPLTISNNLDRNLNLGKIASKVKPLRKYVLTGITALTIATNSAEANPIKQDVQTEFKSETEKVENNKNTIYSKWINYMEAAILGIIGVGAGIKTVNTVKHKRKEKEAELNQLLQKMFDRHQKDMENDEIYRLNDHLELVRSFTSIFIYKYMLNDMIENWDKDLQFRKYSLRQFGPLGDKDYQEFDEKCFPPMIDCQKFRQELDNWINLLEANKNPDRCNSEDFCHRIMNEIEHFLSSFYYCTLFGDEIGNKYYQQHKAKIYDFIDEIAQTTSKREQYNMVQNLRQYQMDSFAHPKKQIEEYEAQIWSKKLEYNEQILQS